MYKVRFTFNDELWEQGFKYGCEYNEQDGLTISSDNAMLKGENTSVKAVYISKALDSTQFETIWNRVKINSVLPEDSMISFSYFANDKAIIEYEKELILLDEYINNNKIGIVDKLSFLDNFWIEEIKNPNDILISKAKGRYLWFKLEIVSRFKNLPKIKELKVEFGQESFMKYLPEFYTSNQENFNFLNRFLGVYQSMILDLQEDIFNISRYMDSDCADEEFLQWLSQWVAIDDTFMWSEKKLRKFIKKSFYLYKMKGTKEGLSRIIELYTGKAPVISETYEIMNCYDKNVYREKYQKLYGEDSYSFTVFIEERYVPTNQKLLELKRIVDLYKPAHTVANVVVLKPFMNLGQHIYIGINSNISQNLPLKLDGNTMIPFSTTILS